MFFLIFFPRKKGKVEREVGGFGGGGWSRKAVVLCVVVFLFAAVEDGDGVGDEEAGTVYSMM